VIVHRAFASKVRVPLVWRGLRFDAGVLGEIVRVGAPAFCAYGTMTVGIAALTVIVAHFGPEASAAYGIGFRLVTMLFIPAMGLSQAALTLVGHLAGGGIFRQARRASWMAIFVTLGGMTLLGVGIALGAAPLARLFTDDPEVLALARRYVQVVGPAVGCAGAAMVVGSCFQGFGRGLPALMLTALRVVGVSIPFAYLFGVVAGLGPAGVWLAVSLSSIATGAAGIGWFALAMRHARRISSRAPSLAPAP
jgi:Na+-driven multidrug efflux pump